MPLLYFPQAKQVHILTHSQFVVNHPSGLQSRPLIECTDIELAGAEVYYDAAKCDAVWPQPHELFPQEILKSIFKVIVQEQKSILQDTIQSHIPSDVTLQTHCGSYDQPFAQDRSIFVTVLPKNQYLTRNIFDYIERPNFIHQKNWIPSLPIHALQFENKAVLAYCESLDSDHEEADLDWLKTMKDVHFNLFKPYIEFVLNLHRSKFTHGDLHERNGVLSYKFKRVILFDFKQLGSAEYFEKEENKTGYYFWQYFRLNDLVNLANTLLLHVYTYCSFVNPQTEPFLQYLKQISHRLDFIQSIDPEHNDPEEEKQFADYLEPHLEVTIEAVYNEWQRYYAEYCDTEAFNHSKRYLATQSIYTDIPNTASGSEESDAENQDSKKIKV